MGRNFTNDESTIYSEGWSNDELSINTASQMEDRIKGSNISCVDFVNEFLFCVDSKKGNIKSNLFKHQEELLKGVEERGVSKFLSSRQLGLTSVLSAYIIYYAVKNPSSNILFIDYSRASSRHFMDRVFSNVYNYLEFSSLFNNDELMKDIFFRFSKRDKKMEFFNGSKIQFSIGTKGILRGQGKDLVIIDNAGFCKCMDGEGDIDIIPGKKILVTSGSQYNQHIDGDPELIKVPWYKHSKHRDTLVSTKYMDESSYIGETPFINDWYREMCFSIGGDEETINRELNCISKKVVKKKKVDIITFRLSDDIKIGVGNRLIEKDMTMSDYIRNLIENDLKNE